MTHKIPKASAHYKEVNITSKEHSLSFGPFYIWSLDGKRLPTMSSLSQLIICGNVLTNPSRGASLNWIQVQWNDNYGWYRLESWYRMNTLFKSYSIWLHYSIFLVSLLCMIGQACLLLKIQPCQEFLNWHK